MTEMFSDTSEYGEAMKRRKIAYDPAKWETFILIWIFFNFWHTWLIWRTMIYFTSHITSDHITSDHITSHQITLHHISYHNITSHYIFDVSRRLEERVPIDGPWQQGAVTSLMEHLAKVQLQLQLRLRLHDFTFLSITILSPNLYNSPNYHFYSCSYFFHFLLLFLFSFPLSSVNFGSLISYLIM